MKGIESCILRLLLSTLSPPPSHLHPQVRTDDITMILAFLDHETHGRAPRPAPEEEINQYELLVEAG